MARHSNPRGSRSTTPTQFLARTACGVWCGGRETRRRTTAPRANAASMTSITIVACSDGAFRGETLCVVNTTVYTHRVFSSSLAQVHRGPRVRGKHGLFQGHHCHGVFWRDDCDFLRSARCFEIFRVAAGWLSRWLLVTACAMIDSTKTRCRRGSRMP